MNNYNKDSKIIIIKEGTKVIDTEYFFDFDKVEEIIMPDSVEYISRGAFKGCKSLKKINLSKNLHILEEFAFYECESLEEITIPDSLHYLSYSVFRNCTNLKTINIHDNINYIDDYALYNCESLENFDIPKNTTSIGKFALMGCKKLKSIHIPKKMDNIEVGAFSLVDSLETIVVDENNEKYLSYNDDTVLLDNDGVLIQYAINSNNEKFICGYYEVEIDNDDIGRIDQLIYNIADYAFAGAKKLKEFYISSELESIGGNTFLNCDNLKKLVIYNSPFGKTFCLNIHKNINDKSSIPFENIIIEEGVQTLCDDMSDLFKNATTVILPNTIEQIGTNVFKKSKKLDNLIIPNHIRVIFPNTFHENINLIFEDIGNIKAKDFNLLQTKNDSDDFNYRNDIKTFSLNDGSYYIKVYNNNPIKITKDNINNLSNTSYLIENNPEYYIKYLIGLLKMNIQQIQTIHSNDELNQKFKNLIKDFDSINDFAQIEINNAIQKIIDESDVHDNFLFSIIFMKKLNINETIKILENYNKSINRFIRYSKRIHNIEYNINIDKLIKYCNLLEKYQRYDKFLYEPIFYELLPYENQELLLKYYNKNLKNLIINSNTLNTQGDDLNDFMKVCKIMGVFSDDKIFSQKMCTFLNEKIMNRDDNLAINGHKIHNIFNDLYPRKELDYEFISLFVNDYDKLIKTNNDIPGFISRIYNSFRDISKTSTSNRGSQRHLKVTYEKCIDYLLTAKFENVTEENRSLAEFLLKYFSENNILEKAESIINESKNAPRNIFSKINYDENNNPIYSYDSNEDLYERNYEDFSYQWLPKQDYENLILGKCCDCCAHIMGAGAGIMRASMILDNCQNMVIRNEIGEIVAKMTIYVNRKEGYAVFNTVEVNDKNRSDSQKEKIYQAFIRGTEAFIKQYNKNNTIPISIVTVGEYRNAIKDNLGNINTTVYKTPNYSQYGYIIGDKAVGGYNGDSKEKQILVLKKKSI